MGRSPKYDDDEILDRAMEVLWRRGWSQTSIRDLERILDLKAPSIYRRFVTKEGLGAAVVAHYVERVVRRRVDKHLSGEGDPVANITRFLELSVTQVDADERLRGCLLTTTALEAAEPGDQLAAALQYGFGVIEDGIDREVRRAAALGRLAADVDAGDATSTLVLAMQGLMAMARAGAPPEALRARARAATSVVARA